MLSILLSTLSGLIFGAVYFLSPHEVAAQYSAIALTISITIEILIKQFYLKPLSRNALAIYLLIYFFTIPAIIFNDLKFIQYKFYAFKISFIIFILFAQFKLKFNLIQKVFGKLFPKVSSLGWIILNMFFVFYLATTVAISLYVQFNFDMKYWVAFKAAFLPAYGFVIFLMMIAYAYIDVQRHKRTHYQVSLNKNSALTITNDTSKNTTKDI